MSTITAILMPSADGTLHLPLPAAWRHQSIRVKAELEPVTDAAAQEARQLIVTPKAGSLKGFRMSADFDEPLEDFKEYVE
ncbi:MAG: DUF2281 domain-containing protein [Prosthecobacter sp.]